MPIAEIDNKIFFWDLQPSLANFAISAFFMWYDHISCQHGMKVALCPLCANEWRVEREKRGQREERERWNGRWHWQVPRAAFNLQSPLHRHERRTFLRHRTESTLLVSFRGEKQRAISGSHISRIFSPNGEAEEKPCGRHLNSFRWSLTYHRARVWWFSLHSLSFQRSSFNPALMSLAPQ